MMKRKYSALLAVAGAAVMLSGCNIYRPYSRPQMETAGLYRDTVSVTDTLSGDTVNFGNRPWQEVFTDPKLQSLIEQGLSSNIDLLSAALVVQEYQAQLTAARLAYVPSFTLAPSGELSWVQHGSLQKTYTLPLSASWEVDLFGKLLNSKRGAKAAWLQSEATLRAVRTQVISGIATGYYTLLMLDRQLEITEQTIENWSLTVRMMKAMKLAGNVNEAAVVQSEANYYAVCASKTDLLRSIRETENVAAGTARAAYRPGRVGRAAASGRFLGGRSRSAFVEPSRRASCRDGLGRCDGQYERSPFGVLSATVYRR